MLAVSQVTMVVQVNGKVRERVDVPPDISSEEAERLALSLPRVASHLGGNPPRTVVVRPPRLVNVVT